MLGWEGRISEDVNICIGGGGGIIKREEEDDEYKEMRKER